ncbi:DNA mismatch repair protein MutS [Microbacterium protaetiae]|uniref:DNA mismatch repair protein MutS n=1 Tax=Microbacterium protaetiae TaxID=2509458 RepID=A0A4P6EHG1_9MICO|nr:DNA mismatch repair protein MutS [Microbacterium protaetiae]QAY59547.1 DNA mismatch repair protein MutS [Microbacterium protaetiae]
MTTTIKVSDELRDRLKTQASRTGRTLGAHLAVLADLADRQDRLTSMKQAIAATPASVLAEYRTESEQWETTELADARHE